MSPATHLLLPQLPPELRNEIYTYLSAPYTSQAPALTTSLPLQLKTYTCKHTTLHIVPTHTSCTALLALQSHAVLEAFEYAAFLRTNAVELKLGLEFTGRVNTFCPEAWGKKVSAHLTKLVKRHAWLGKVVRYDVKIVWEPMDGGLRSKRGRRTAGMMVREMVRVLMGLMERDLRKRKGDVRVEVVLGRGFAVGNTLQHMKFGLAGFFAAEEGFKKVTKSVVRQAPLKDKKEGEMLVVEGEVVRWGGLVEGDLVMRRTVEGEKELETVVGDIWRGREGDSGFDFVLSELLQECQGRR